MHKITRRSFGKMVAAGLASGVIPQVNGAGTGDPIKAADTAKTNLVDFSQDVRRWLNKYSYVRNILLVDEVPQGIGSLKYGYDSELHYGKYPVALSRMSLRDVSYPETWNSVVVSGQDKNNFPIIKTVNTPVSVPHITIKSFSPSLPEIQCANKPTSLNLDNAGGIVKTYEENTFNQMLLESNCRVINKYTTGINTFSGLVNKAFYHIECYDHIVSKVIVHKDLKSKLLDSMGFLTDSNGDFLYTADIYYTEDPRMKGMIHCMSSTELGVLSVVQDVCCCRRDIKDNVELYLEYGWAILNPLLISRMEWK